MSQKLRRYIRRQPIDGARERWGYRDTPYAEDDDPTIQCDAEGRNYAIPPYGPPIIDYNEPQLMETHVFTPTSTAAESSHTTSAPTANLLDSRTAV